MRISEIAVLNLQKAQKFKQTNGQLSAMGSTSQAPKDNAKEKVEILAKKK